MHARTQTHTHDDTHTHTYTHTHAGVQAISAGFDRTMILKTDGSVWAAGRRDYRGWIGDDKVDLMTTFEEMVSSGL